MFESARRWHDWLASEDDDGRRLVARSLLLVAVFVVVKTSAEHAFNLPTASFERPVLLLEVVTQGWAGRLRGAFFLCVLGATIAGGVLLARRRGAGPLMRWDALDQGAALRWIVCTAAFLVTWYVVAMAPNRWTGNSYPMDRLLVLALFVWTVFRPIGALGVGVFCMPLVYQLFHPFGGYSAAEIDLPIYLCLLAGTATLLQAATGLRLGRALVYVILCLFAANYWIPGWGKLSSAWILDDQIRFLLPATYLNGWWGSWTAAEVGQVTAMLAPLNAPMKLATLVLEVGVLLLLVSRRWLLLIVPMMLLFHTGVFLLAGICFWKWMTLEVVLLAMFARYPGLLGDDLFHPLSAGASIVFVLASPWWCNPPQLAWQDSRVSVSYQVEGIGVSGERYLLQPSFFEPYRYAFTMTPFAFLVPEPVLSVTWGASTAQAAAKLNTARSVEDVEILRQEQGRVRFHAPRTRRFDDLVRGYLERAMEPDEWWRPLRAPAHLWTFASPEAYARQEPLLSAEVVQRTSLYVEGRFEVVSERPVRTIAR